MKYTKTEINESTEALLRWLKPGMTVCTILDHCSKSGMARDIRLVLTDADGPTHLSYHAARVLGYSMRGGAIRISGCGMDMGFALVYELSSKLFPHDEKKPRESGGYALKQRWL